ncbi:hypothetical protein [Bdellovibrio sp. HCB337]|uniref:hypothetical protein n=1 Tax=Bdellovibrio sp. HCB337 TaxID=3394358 RepID=UPI0039A764E7
MFFQALSRILVIVGFLMASYAVPVLANDPPPAEHEKKEEGAKEGGESEATESQKKQISEATELQAKVQALQAKIKSKEENINKLIQEKNHTKDAERVKEIIAEMVTEHKDLSKMIVEYEQNRSLLRYRYPEKGYSGSRAYERMEVKPLDQMENQMSVEAKLKRNLKTVRSQYGEPAETKDKKKKSGQKKEAEAPSLTEPIVLQK